MSADLFAEFNSLSGPPPQQNQEQQKRPPPPPLQPQPQQLPPQHHHQHQQSQGQSLQSPGAASQDLFGLWQGDNQQQPPPPPPPPQASAAQSWGTFQDTPPSLSGWGSSSNTASFSNSAPAAAADDEDGWGDFEVADSAPSGPAAPEPSSSWQAPVDPPAKPPANPVARAAVQNPVPNRLVRASTMDIINNNLVDIPFSVRGSQQTPQQTPEVEKPRPKFKEPNDPSVMFDAQDFELEGGEGEDDDEDNDDDDFGDFETVGPTQPRPAPAPAQAPREKKPEALSSLDLLSLDDPPPYEEVQAPKPQRQPATQSKPPPKPSPLLNFGATKTSAAKSQPLSRAPKTATPSSSSKLRQASVAKDDDEWSAWDEFEPTSAAVETATSSTADNWNWDAAGPATPAPKTDTVPDDAPPPVNVPPPSVILSAFPSLFSTGDSLFKPVAGQTSSIKQRVLSDPKTVDFLHGYVLIATTAARVIAGRKQRWHRDKILAKSMSISAAGSKGMKLAGVDKTQTAREDREAADVAAAWKEYVGKLRSAVAAANSAGKASLKVPEIGENIPVHTAKLVPTAPKPCVVCGLKRDERVAKVDFDVEDSFGEWWVEHWGHRACKNFWVQHEQALRQR